MITIYPYDTLVGDIRLSVNMVTIDGKALSTNFINPDLPEIAFAEVDRDRWDEALIEVTVTAPAAELTGNPAWEQLTAAVQLFCTYTNHRRALKLTEDPHTPGRWHGTVILNRDEWFGRGTMRAVLSATVESTPYRIIGTGDTWTLSFDDLPPSPVHGSIAVQWVDFANDDAHGLKPFREDPYHLRLDPSAPALYLNSGFDGLEALLGDRRRRPRAEQAMHDSTRTRFACDTWQAMFVASLDSVEIDPETRQPEWPDEPWRVVVLKTIFPRIYPHLGPEDALIEAVHARSSKEGSGQLLELLLPAAAAQVGAAPLLRRGISLLEKDADTKENEL